MAQDGKELRFSDGSPARAVRNAEAEAYELRKKAEADQAVVLEERLAQLRRYHRAQMDDQLLRRATMFARVPPDVSITALTYAKEEAEFRSSILAAKGKQDDGADIRMFDAVVQERAVHYRAEGSTATAFTDDGKHIDVQLHQDKAALLAALQLAEQRWGVIKVTGDEAFKSQVVELAAEHDMQLSNKDLMERVALIKGAGRTLSAPDEPEVEPAPVQAASASDEMVVDPDDDVGGSEPISAPRSRGDVAEETPAPVVPVPDSAPVQATRQPEQAEAEPIPAPASEPSGDAWVAKMREELDARKAAKADTGAAEPSEDEDEFIEPGEDDIPNFGVDDDDDFSVSSTPATAPAPEPARPKPQAASVRP